MNKIAVTQSVQSASFLPFAQGILQRKCACGNHTIAGGECAECAKKTSGLRRKPTIGASNDPLEREADRVAEQVTAAPTHSVVSSSTPRIQRHTGQTSAQPEKVPASVERVLGSSGRPLDIALRKDMESRFGHDFSQVQVHLGAAAEQSAREVNANAYTVGQNIVFGAGRFAPNLHEGRRLIAHELTHVVQQTGGSRLSSEQTGLPSSNLHLQRDKLPPKQPQPSDACQSATLADKFKPTNTWGGKTWDPQLGAKEFGSTSKLAANFGFGACKDKGQWHFHLNKLEAMITSKVQPQGFRINVASASDSAVTQDQVTDIMADLRPNRKVTFHPGCGTDKYDDKVKTYSLRDAFWNRQFVEDHEAFHRKDWETMYRAELVKAEANVRSHTLPEKDAGDSASAVAKVRTDLDKYMIDAYQNACKAYSPQQESRAYDDGAPQYQKLVDEIKARAVKEKWISASNQKISPDIGGEGFPSAPSGFEPPTEGETIPLLSESGLDVDVRQSPPAVVEDVDQ
ncbi:MAG: DUF4157 domain-containing protein [Methylobacter sp.]|nr:DUF4157 domain-containing protein [Candidatus Methylobacter titanis]